MPIKRRIKMTVLATSLFDRIGLFLSHIYMPSMLVFVVIGVLLSCLSFYNTPYMILGLFFTRKYKPAKNYHKYAILIPGRNEEPVIANLINSIKKQDYPQEYLTIFVCADNCTDNTAKVARDNGAICYEHFNPDERTKGFALKYLFEQIEKDYGIESFEGYFIFDADNLLKKDYISRMNESFDAGEKIITSYRSTKNLTEGWVASLYAVHWLGSIRFKHRPRSFLHLATNIQGTGFLFSNEIVKDGWKYTSLTEDRALTADCVVNGYEISYNNDAIFYDEQPTNLKVALRQRLRWAKGHLQAFAESGWGLFKNIFVDRNTKHEPGDKWYSYTLRTIRHRFMSLDTFSQLLPRQIVTGFKWLFWNLFLFPFTIYECGGDMQFFGSSIIGKFMHFMHWDWLIHLEPGWESYFKCVGIVICVRFFYHLGVYLKTILYAVYVFIIERKRIQKISLGKKILYCITWPLYDVIERWVKYIALFVKVEWKPIPHNSKITIEDIEN